MRYARTHGRLVVVRLSRSCLRNSGCTTACNKSKLTVTEAHTISLQLYNRQTFSTLTIAEQNKHRSCKNDS